MNFIEIIYEEPEDEDNSNGASNFLDEANGMETQDFQEDLSPGEAAMPDAVVQSNNLTRTSNNNSEDPTTSSSILVGWGHKDSKLLLKKYNKYILLTGRANKFRTKRELWNQIAIDMKNELNIYRSSFQCENRYKTLLRTWRRSGKRNNMEMTGFQRKEIKNRTSQSPPKVKTVTPVEVDSIREDDVDDEVAPVPEVSSVPEETKKQTVSNVLWEIFKQKEESRERRHKEKMQLIKSLLQTL